MLAPLAIGVWATDWVTLAGEWTIYTASCSGGEWQGDKCTGTRLAGPRHRFRALRAHSEVIFWTVGSTGGSGRLSPCTIENRRNWSCQPGPDSPRAVTLALDKGSCAKNPTWAGGPVHVISKVTWYYLRFTSGRAPLNSI